MKSITVQEITATRDKGRQIKRHKFHHHQRSLYDKKRIFNARSGHSCHIFALNLSLTGKVKGADISTNSTATMDSDSKERFLKPNR